MVDHVALSVRDFEASLQFYDATLSMLGMSRTLHVPSGAWSMAAYGHDNRTQFFINGLEEGKEFRLAEVQVCLAGGSAGEIRGWYDRCLEMGGQSIEPPTAHPDWHPGYYGASVADPSGWRIDACIHNHSQDQ